MARQHRKPNNQLAVKGAVSQHSFQFLPGHAQQPLSEERQTMQQHEVFLSPYGTQRDTDSTEGRSRQKWGRV